MSICNFLPSTWAIVSSMLQFFLTSKTGYINFVHPYFKDAVQTKFCKTLPQTKKFRKMIIDYFVNVIQIFNINIFSFVEQNIFLQIY